jgi:hypothetical protein
VGSSNHDEASRVPLTIALNMLEEETTAKAKEIASIILDGNNPDLDALGPIFSL